MERVPAVFRGRGDSAITCHENRDLVFHTRDRKPFYFRTFRDFRVPQNFCFARFPSPILQQPILGFLLHNFAVPLVPDLVRAACLHPILSLCPPNLRRKYLLTNEPSTLSQHPYLAATDAPQHKSCTVSAPLRKRYRRPYSWRQNSPYSSGKC
jgi:hypothetical protein